MKSFTTCANVANRFLRYCKGIRFTAILTVLFTLGVGQMWGDTYERLTSIADIDESAQYVLGVDGTGFHYSGTSSWGKTALPANQTPYKYTLKKAADGKSFTAKTTISGTTYYLQIPTSNTFSMSTSTGTNTDIIIGTTTNCTDKAYAVANKSTTARHLRINGTAGLRSYAGTTGTIAFFYKVVTASKTLSSIAVSSQRTEFTVGDSFEFGGTVTATYSNSTTADVTSSATFSGYNMSSVGEQTVTVSYTEGSTTRTATYNITVSPAQGGGGSGSGECTWELVTDASSLAAGDEIVIAAKDYNYAISTTQNNNNRGQAAITKNGNTITFGDNVQVITLQQGVSYNGTFVFYTGSGYLYAAGANSNNYLRTSSTTIANGDWSISVTNNTAFITACGSATRNVLKYNTSGLFSCYASDNTQKELAIYKKVCGNQATPTLTASTSSLAFGDVTVNSSKQLTFTLSGSGLTANATLALSGTNASMFTVSPNSVNQSSGSINNQTITVTYTPTTKATHTATLTISSSGADNVTVSLTGTGIAQTANYTIKHYQQNLDGTYPSTPTDTETKSGEVGTEVTPTVKTYPGFTAPSTKTVTIKSDGSTVVTYQYTRNSYTLTWNLDGGTIVTAGTTAGLVKYGASLTAPTVTKEEYNFKNWNPSVPSTMPASDATYTAQWTPVYTITWLANGQEFHKQENAVEGTALDLPDSEPDAATYACDDKVFVGWTSTSISGTTDDEPADLFTTKTANVEDAASTYYAVFATEEDGGGSTGETTTVAVGDQVVIIQVDNNTTELTGFRSDKDITDANNYGTYAAYNTTPAGTLVWTVEEGASSGTFAFKNGNYYLNLGDNDNHLNCSTTKNAYSSWTISESNDRAVVTNVQYDSRKIMWNQTSTRFACYNKNHGLNSSQYYYHIKFYKYNAGTSYSDYTTSCDNTKANVTYDLNGGAGATCEKVTVTKDVAFNLCSETPTKDGYTFAGWSDGTKTYAAGAEVTVSDNTTFYASWKAKSITITWNLNYTGSPEAATTTYIYNGEEIEMPEDPTRTGYKFDGWYTAATDGTKVTEVGETNKPSADVTYYAHWLEQYTVTYFASGQQYLKQEYKYTSGDKLVLPETDPSAANFACDGYLFEGWSTYQQTKEDANCPELVNENTSVDNDLELHAVWKKATVSGVGTQIFYESFDTEEGTGANDGDWGNDVGTKTLVNTTWTFANGYGAYQCVKLGSSKNRGSATTPALTQLSGDATLSFKAAAWVNNNETTTLNLSISGGGTLTPNRVTMTKGAWTTYEVQIKEGTSSSKITFSAANTANNRFFLDEVKITTTGGYNYTTSPSCGPTMVAKENVWATSAKGQKVKVNVPVGVKLFTGAATITGTSTNDNFIVNALENVGNGEHNLEVVYTPTADDTKENTTITLTAKNGEEVWSTTTFTLNGRSLPSEFVVVANKGDKNYALPANMTQANVYGGLVVEVSGEEVTAAPKSHLYNARAVHSTRFANNGTALRLVGNNDACLWASSAANGTNIRNWAKLENAKSENYEWNLYTEDGDTYYISSSAVTEEGRVLRLDGTNFGMYKQGVNAFRLLPVGCTSTPMNVQTSTTRTSATISWTNASECDVEVRQGSTTVKTIPAVASPLVVSDLAESTAYTFTLTPAENASCSAAGSFTTTGPTIDIVEWQTGGIRIYVDKDENVNPKVIINGEEEHGSVGGQVATELFFSKYYEAHAENKLLAVYNGTAGTIDLSGYVIKHGEVEIDLSQYGQTKGSIAPNEEIILVAFDNDASKSAESCAEKEEGFNTWNVLAKELLAFSGRGSVGLYKDDQLIDLIGSVYPSGELTKIGKSGSPDNCGTGEGVRLHVGGLSVNDQSSFFCHDGDNIKTKEVETNYPISTNRCLLIRKNTVTSGADAVASNKADAGAECGDLSSTFATLCSEWSGFRIGSGSSSDAEIQEATCEGLGYVGGFDYNNYYRTMETIHTGKTLDEYDRNPDDNTYFIEFANVSDYSCLNIQLQLTDNDGNVLTDQITQVPILVSDQKTTTSEIFSAIVKDGENPDYENSKIRCATCDVVILESATLTKAAPGTANDVNQVRDIYVYPGGKLIVPEGANDYNVNSVSLRRDQDEVAAASIQAPLTITSSSNTPVYVDIRINSENWHWMTLPYDCNIADVTWKNGSKAIYNSDWFLMYYDGEQRAATQAGGHWYVYEGTTIEAGKGYIVGITGHPTKSGVQYELRFPMAKEVLTKENENKKVDVYAWGVEDNIKATHKGWNLVGNPYLDYYLKDEVNTFGGLRLGGKYEKDDTGHWYDTGMWGGETTNLPYLVVPVNGGWESYDQVLVSETDMKPFTSYFVQVGETTENHTNGEKLDVIFDASKLRNKPQSIIQRSASEEEPVIVGVSLINAQGESDKTSLVIDNQFTDEYEMNADFFKWFGDYYKYYTKPVLYSIGADQGKRAFNAFSEDLASQPISLGMYAARAGDYTFSLDKRSDLFKVQEVWLYDATQDTYTNLLQDSYTFQTAKTESAGRFFLSVKMAPKVSTDINNITNGSVWATTQDKNILVNGLLSNAQLWIYDATGKLLLTDQTQYYQHSYSVPVSGTYFVRVQNTMQTQTIKVVVE